MLSTSCVLDHRGQLTPFAKGPRQIRKGIDSDQFISSQPAQRLRYGCKLDAASVKRRGRSLSAPRWLRGTLLEKKRGAYTTSSFSCPFLERSLTLSNGLRTQLGAQRGPLVKCRRSLLAPFVISSGTEVCEHQIERERYLVACLPRTAHTTLHTHVCSKKEPGTHLPSHACMPRSASV